MVVRHCRALMIVLRFSLKLVNSAFAAPNAKELNLFQNELGRSRGMGHCLFQSPQEAQLAIQELRDVDVGGRPIWIAEDSRGKTPLSGKGGKGAGKGPMGAMHRAQPY